MASKESFRKEIEYRERELELAENPGCIMAFLQAFGLWSNRNRVRLCKRNLDDARASLNEISGYEDDVRAMREFLEATVLVCDVVVLQHTFIDLDLSGNLNYPDNWEELRQIILTRDRFSCQEADSTCRGPLQIHHKRFLSQGGSNAESNLITLCGYHHALKHPGNKLLERWMRTNAY